MTYEEVKPKASKRHSLEYELGGVGTGKILWHLVRRHKFAISVALNVLLVVNWAVPMWPSIVASIF